MPNTTGMPRAGGRGRQDGDQRTVLGKVLAILAAFNERDATLGLPELTRRTGLPKSTVHRLTRALADAELLEAHASGYQLGIRLFELGELVPAKRALRAVALPYMQDLYEATHETVHLGILDEFDVLYVEKISGHRESGAPSRVGGRMPLHCTGLGKALLAASPPELLERVVAAGLSPYTPHTITVPSVLRAAIDSVRQRGVAFDREESRVGVSCVAVPVTGVDGEVVAAVSVTGASARMAFDRLAPAVQTAARALTREVRRVRLGPGRVSPLSAHTRRRLEGPELVREPTTDCGADLPDVAGGLADHPRREQVARAGDRETSDRGARRR